MYRSTKRSAVIKMRQECFVTRADIKYQVRYVDMTLPVGQPDPQRNVDWYAYEFDTADDSVLFMCCHVVSKRTTLGICCVTFPKCTIHNACRPAFEQRKHRSCFKRGQTFFLEDLRHGHRNDMATL